MILAIDPGNIESGFVLLNDDLSIIDKGKISNNEMLEVLYDYICCDQDIEKHIAIEMIASYGMAVGQEVFETCVWIGKFYHEAYLRGVNVKNIQYIYRKDEKINICGSMKAKDGNIIQALIDRFAPGVRNKGKGTKKEPGWFYGFKKDIWQAYAVGVTYHDMYLMEEKK